MNVRKYAGSFWKGITGYLPVSRKKYEELEIKLTRSNDTLGRNLIRQTERTEFLRDFTRTLYETLQAERKITQTLIDKAVEAETKALAREYIKKLSEIRNSSEEESWKQRKEWNESIRGLDE